MPSVGRRSRRDRVAKQAITITAAAVDRVKYLLAQRSEPAVGLRIGVKARGCSGYSYNVEYADKKMQFDEEIQADGATVFIDPAAVMFLIGSEMDYVESKFETGFTFKNPNEKGRCGCGESFTV
ncbi:HesB/IscA family protein [Lacibacterium aquatile]|uniref:HesB/IscA family protein n=1 Tax=Lacibacterium aquatile TaxID=1168082 RepID=A0ABW5DK49_9PROT